MEMEHGGDNNSHQEDLEAIYFRLVQMSMAATGGRRGISQYRKFWSKLQAQAANYSNVGHTGTS